MHETLDLTNRIDSNMVSPQLSQSKGVRQSLTENRNYTRERIRQQPSPRILLLLGLLLGLFSPDTKKSMAAAEATNKIVGGSPASRGEFPFFGHWWWNCGTALIAPGTNHVLQHLILDDCEMGPFFPDTICRPCTTNNQQLTKLPISVPRYGADGRTLRR